ncbi:Glycosyltransferase family 22 protein [Mycena kentingensis (nom. inval.)]|nr:Glycosyltransferase family 22 protein [Mycena kentingensis (nom. inval.)]
MDEQDHRWEESELSSAPNSSDEGLDVKVTHETARTLLETLLPQAFTILDAAVSIPDEYRATQREALQNAALQLQKSGQHKFALIGETGAGKSTLVNALLGKNVLSASASGACTSVPTEISYHNAASIHVTVQFKTAAIWEQDLEKFLVEATNSPDAEESAEDNSPAFTLPAREKLVGIFPQLGGIPVDHWNKDILLVDDAVSSLLGQCQRLTYAANSSTLQTELEKFVASAAHDGRTLWPLIQCVRVVGPFKALRNGITLVDLPGYGDADSTRDRAAKEYLVTADSVFLVARIARAADSRALLLQLESHLKNLILSGRARDKSIAIILTGADARVANHEVSLSPGEQAEVDALEKTANDYATIIESRKKDKKQEEKKNKRDKRNADTALLDRLNEEVKRAKKRKRNVTRRMNKILALARGQLAAARLTERFTAMYQDLATDATATAPMMPVFCVGSRDHMCLKGLDTNDPEVFFRYQDTAIPALQKYLEREGERQTLVQMRHIVSAVCSFLGWAREPPMGAAASLRTEDVARRVDALKARCFAELEKMVKDDQAAYAGLMQQLGGALQEAAKQAPRIFDSHERKKWNQYAAMMRQRGRYMDGQRVRDLNEDLTNGIWSSIDKTWNHALNVTLPLNDVAFRKFIKDEVELMFKNFAPSYPPLADPRNHLRTELSTLLGLLEESNRTATAEAQRKGVRLFAETMEIQLRPQYARVSQETGNGMFRRMKTANRQYIRTYAPSLFDTIGETIRQLFDEPLLRVEKVDRAGIDLFFKKLKQSFTAVQVESGNEAIADGGLRTFAQDHGETCHGLLEMIKQTVECSE